MSRGQVEFANLVVRADKKELLDLFDDWFLPALLNEEYRRKWGETTWFFHHVQGFTFDWGATQQAVLAGRFVKRGKLKREQYFDEGTGIVRDQKSMDTAPTALFMIVLNSHKVVYLHETDYAPPLKQFASTLEWVVKEEHYRQLRARFDDAREKGQPMTLAELKKDYPVPSVDVIPLPMGEEISAFIDRFEVLTQITAQLVRPNNELNLNPLFQKLRNEGDRLNAKATTITQRNAEGLSPKAAKQYVESAAKQGNTKLRLGGKDDDGNDLRGDNFSFVLKAKLAAMAKSFSARVQQMFGVFREMVEKEQIALTSESEASDTKALAIAKEHNWDGAPAKKEE